MLIKVCNHFYITFSSIFSIFDNREIEQKLLWSNFEAFLKVGTKSAVLNDNGKTLVMKDNLNQHTNFLESHVLEEKLIYDMG